MIDGYLVRYVLSNFTELFLPIKHLSLIRVLSLFPDVIDCPSFFSNERKHCLSPVIYLDQQISKYQDFSCLLDATFAFKVNTTLDTHRDLGL